MRTPRFIESSRSGLLALAALQFLGGIVHAIPTQPQNIPAYAPIYYNKPAPEYGEKHGKPKEEYKKPNPTEYTPPEVLVTTVHETAHVVETQSVHVTERVTEHITVHETETIQQHVTKHVTVVETLPPIHITMTEISEHIVPTTMTEISEVRVTMTEISDHIIPTTVVSFETLVHTAIYTSIVPTTIVHTLDPIIQTVQKHVTETETLIFTKLQEVVSTEVQISHLVHTQIETQVMVHSTTATITATKVVDKVQTETVHNVLTETATATEVVHGMSIETEVSVVHSVDTKVINKIQTETVHNILTETATATEVVHSVATETVHNIQTETATALSVVHSIQTVTVHQTQVVNNILTKVATETATETIHNVQTRVLHNILTETATQVIHSIQTEIVNNIQTATQTIHDVQTEVLHSILTETVHNIQTETTTALGTETLYTTTSSLYAGAPQNPLVVHLTSTVTVCLTTTTPSLTTPASSLTSTAMHKPAGVTHTVSVGGDAGLIYTPLHISAAVGDTVHFVFYSQNHTVTQSTFNKPCIKNAITGVDSGYKPNINNAVVPPPFWDYVVDTTDPTWWYCAHETHCGKGMVFAINPTVEKTYKAFKEAAVAQNGTDVGYILSGIPIPTTFALKTSSSFNYSSIDAIISTASLQDLQPIPTSIVTASAAETTTANESPS
ncbi:hypothetical protein BDD12DRAFT_874076 [Trichophaea hybrida]|nr:hypothetical protein BDD12DRAFT_874076 [Trichophaea hybrida]